MYVCMYIYCQMCIYIYTYIARVYPHIKARPLHMDDMLSSLGLEVEGPTTN